MAAAIDAILVGPWDPTIEGLEALTAGAPGGSAGSNSELARLRDEAGPLAAPMGGLDCSEVLGRAGALARAADAVVTGFIGRFCWVDRAPGPAMVTPGPVRGAAEGPAAGAPGRAGV